MRHDPVPLEVLLTRVGAAVVRHRRRLAAQHGLTPTAMAVLAALAEDTDTEVSDTDAVSSGATATGATATGAATETGAAAVEGDVEGGAEDHGGGAPSHRELAGRLGLSPATLTPVLDALETAGEVRRERDRVDRRVVRVRRTSAGRSHLEAARSRTLLPQPDPEVEPAVRAYLLAVLAAVEAEE